MLAVVAAVVTTASPAGGTDVMTWLIAQGPLGIICVGLIIALRKESNRADSERARADAADAGKDAMVSAFIERIVPALTESTAATRELADVRRRRE
jgi:hypothetical protein